MAETPFSQDSTPEETEPVDAIASSIASPADPESVAVADVTPEAASPAPEPEVRPESLFPPALSEPEAIAAPQASETEQQTPPEAAASEASPFPAPASAPAAELVQAEVQAVVEAEPPAGIATTIAVPPLDSSSPAAGGEGGEWELLVGKVNAWFSSGELKRQWQKIRGPLKGLAILIGLILALRLYASLVGTVDRLPVVSGLLELIGLIALVQFGLTKMVRTSTREKVLANWKQRWLAFRGQD
ncbi:MAG: CAAD domain-containing protein [Synechococcaceae cyanobacterium ELA182]